MDDQTKHIDVVSYNFKWQQIFEEEANSLKQALGHNYIDIHHIGSTSILGLSAKNYIDILCIVDNLQLSLSLQKIEYVFKGELNIPLRYYFSKNMSHIKINLHVVRANHGFILLNLCFRDYLRTHQNDCLAYANLKTQLLLNPNSYQLKVPHFTNYTFKKNIFIKGVLKKACFDGLIVNFCMHDDEWETIIGSEKTNFLDL